MKANKQIMADAQTARAAYSKVIEGYTPYIEVFWLPQVPGLCGAFGKSEDLTLD